ncbi:TetR/AcrR family transcriptional regulator [Nocardioides sp.]|uniref:TetR/AcrR family transcriptional regulator n=1 Tax=Nocardioides sp. TaxID=35761 RepID=UPI002733B642|nr:TetR family transcriptional regulator [Nocardioides sp.]MDP3890478.1 TetR family transcriptional regulator [Nocardioides sp.]
MVTAADEEYADGRPLQLRIVAAATDLTAESGWSSVTMARLAEVVGVSRQTVYNEVGSKPALAEAMVLHELARFLEAVERSFDAHPDDLVAAIEAAATAVLTYAQGNRLLHAVVSATHGADTELLPLLTTHSDSLLAAAKAVIGARLEPFDLPFTDHQVDAVIDMVVRVVLSHVMEPSAAPAETAADIAWVASRVLAR